MHCVYLLYSTRLGKHYTGYTRDLNKRLKHHNLGLDRWTKRGIPWKLVYFEKYNKKIEAIKREKFLKTGLGRELIRARVAKVVTARV